MSGATENVRRWIEQSDIDYTTYFIKAWIPFNAWYNSQFSSLDGDRSKINAIKKEGNLVRSGINAYLESDDQLGETFRSYLSGLHTALENNLLDSRDGRISFKQIVKEKNADNVIDEEVRGMKYYVRRFDSVHLGSVDKIQIFLKDRSGKNKFSYEHNAYNFANLQANIDYVNLSDI